MNERLLTESNNGGKISLSAAAGNADSASTTGLPTIHKPESSDSSQAAAIPAAGGSMLQEISNPSASPGGVAIAVGACAESFLVTLRG